MIEKAAVSPDILEQLAALAGRNGAVHEEADKARYLREWRDRWQGRTPLILRPQTTAQVSDIVKFCRAHKLSIVPQGGNTGLVGGQIPNGEILLSLERMKTIRDIDPLDNSMTVEAGCVLETVQQAAADQDRLFPLSLASEGSAQIGGLISTNAGGVHVLRYGTMGDLALGLEVVTADGEIWDGLKSVRKDNTGYRLTDVFVGAEGTLGIITAATLRLFPRPRDLQTIFLAVPDVEAAVRFLSLANGLSGGLVNAFELMPRLGIEFVIKHVEGARDPLAPPSPWYVLAEFAGGQDPGSLRPMVEACFAEALEQNLVSDGVIAENMSQAKDLWLLRERLSEVQRLEGGSLKHDIAVPVSALPAFMTRALDDVTNKISGVRPVPFGHVGDGNIHFNLSQPETADKDWFLSHRDEIAEIVHDIVRNLGGSFSAEHGIGIARLDDMERYKSPAERRLMRQIKSALDPQGIFNPGKVLRSSDP